MEGLQLKLNLAQSSGNDELATTIQCAQENAQNQAQHLTASLEPIGVLLDLAGSLFGIAGVPTIKLPQIGSSNDLAALHATVQAIQEVSVVITIATDALGGCQQ
jgi:ribosomal protein S5